MVEYQENDIKKITGFITSFIFFMSSFQQNNEFKRKEFCSTDAPSYNALNRYISHILKILK